MSKIECEQLRSELFGRRHNTLQSHGLFALAKPLFFYDVASEYVFYCILCVTLMRAFIITT